MADLKETKSKAAEATQEVQEIKTPTLEEAAPGRERVNLTPEVNTIPAELDPSGLFFEQEKFDKFIQTLPDFTTFHNALTKSINQQVQPTDNKEELYKRFAEMGDNIQKATSDLTESINKMANISLSMGINKIEKVKATTEKEKANIGITFTTMQAERMADIGQDFQQITKLLDPIKEQLAAIEEATAPVISNAVLSIATATRRIQEISAAIIEQLREEAKKPEYGGKALEELIKEGTDADGNVKTESMLKHLVIAAIYAKGKNNNATPQAASIPILQAIFPAKHIMPNNALMNKLESNDIIDAGAFDLVVAKAKGRRKEITTYTMVEFNSEENALKKANGVKITPTHLTEFERQVSDAIISIYEQAAADKIEPVFTTDMVYRAMPGSGRKPSQRVTNEIIKTIEKFRKMLIYVDATEEMQTRGLTDKETKTVFSENYCLAQGGIQYKIKNGGQMVAAYKLVSEPVALKYAKMTNQLLTIPAEALEIKCVNNGKVMPGQKVEMSQDRQAMTGYLLRRIARIKYDRREKKAEPCSDIILFQSVFNDAGIDVSSKAVAKRQRDFIFSVLDYQKAIGQIKGYEIQQNGRSISGVKIIP